MADPVEVAIEAALLAHLGIFAAAQSPVITIAQPNVAFTPPSPVTPTTRWLRATFLPVRPTRIISGPNTHSGLFQVDAFYGAGGGELAPARTASALIEHYRDQRLKRDGFTIQINQLPFRDPLVTDSPWVFIPVRIPYQCFAS
ncbi:phage tail terminator-like protein [Pseudorhodoplanes sp.]|uniref:phage tail terminator-like protein n=1 Tax=Pseudorhodoplanes sp. TaxID=1934341 RepID=UPI002BF7FBDB|nr:phage tail terminator-like protein [Pseudorhodoplanes sp.]HWV44130.1 phage tail terminator-like protein [Pseudorhodoplanes sp.]